MPADGNRVKGTANGVNTVYLDGIYEYQNGAVTRYYAGHNGLVAMRKTGYGGSNDGVFYLLNDQLQSTSRILNRNNTIAATLHYFPYGGNRIWPTVSTLTTKRFTGQYQEIPIPGGGLYYYGARWYDAFSGRFISADTIVPDAGNPQDLNRYSYVRNNPVKYTDPTGRSIAYISGGGSCLLPGSCYSVLSQQAAAKQMAEFDRFSGQFFETAASVFFEPADWFFTARDCFSGECSLLQVLATLIPFIPGKVAKFVDPMTTGLGWRVQEAIMQSADDGMFIAVRSRAMGANALDGLYPAKAPHHGEVEKLLDGKRRTASGTIVLSDLDLAGVTLNGVALSNAESIGIGESINKIYRLRVVTHGDLYNGIKMNVDGALGVNLSEFVHVFSKKGYVESLPYTDYVSKYIISD